MTVRDFARANEESRAELADLVARLTEDDLARTVEGGWTVAMLLGHLAFWDRSLELRWQVALDTGLDEPARVPDGLTDILNGALASILEDVPGFAAAARATSAAAAVDVRIAALPDRCVEAAAAAGHIRLLDRSLHRREHIAQIRLALEPS